MTIDLAITPDRRWAAETLDLIAACSAVGFAALGVASDRVNDAVVDAYRESGLRCHELLGLMLGSDEAAMVASAAKVARVAEAIGAEWVLTIFREPLNAETATVIERCSAILADVGAGMAVEFSPLGPVTSINQGLEIVRVGNRGGGRAGLMIDSWHFSFGDSTWDDLARVPLDEIAYVQFADALEPEPDGNLGRETMDRRALPGEGVLELERFASTLLDRGWAGTVSVEVLSAELRTLPARDLVERIHDTTAPYWR